MLLGTYGGEGIGGNAKGGGGKGRVLGGVSTPPWCNFGVSLFYWPHHWLGVPRWAFQEGLDGPRVGKGRTKGGLGAFRGGAGADP